MISLVRKAEGGCGFTVCFRDMGLGEKEKCAVVGSGTRKVDISLLGKGNSNSHGARPVY